MERHDRPSGRSDIGRLLEIPMLRVLSVYGLIERMIERDSGAAGPSPFSAGALRADFAAGTWKDTGGMPVVRGAAVEGDVAGLVQAIEGVGRGKALDILRSRFVLGIRRQASAALGADICAAQRLALDPDVPQLRRLGVPPEIAAAWEVGLCAEGELAGRIAFPLRRPDGILAGYAGLDLRAQTRWSLSPGIAPGRELFGIDRIHRDPRVRQAAIEHGLTLAPDPLEALRMAWGSRLPVVAPAGPGLGRAQIAMLLDGAINPTQSVSVPRQEDRAWSLALLRYRWRSRSRDGDL